MKRRLRKTATFAKAAKINRRVRAVSFNEQELTVLKAISALCGGSGVGQAPEPPQRVEVHESRYLQVDTKSLQGSGSRSRTTPESFDFAQDKFFDKSQDFQLSQRVDPVFEENRKVQFSRSNFQLNSKLQKGEKGQDSRVRGNDSEDKCIFLPSSPNYLQVIEFFPVWTKITRDVLTGFVDSRFVLVLIQHLSEYIGRRIHEFTNTRRQEINANRRIDELRIENVVTDRVIERGIEVVKSDELRIKNNELGIKKQNPKIRKTEKLKKLEYRQGLVRKVVRRGVGAGSYLLILLAIVGLGFTYGPVVKAELAYNARNFQFSIFNFQLNSKFQISKKTENKNKSGEKEKFATVVQVTKTPESKKGKVVGETSLKELPLTNENDINNVKFVSDISIAIPKIDAYSEVFLNVNPADRNEYLPVLSKGVAHAVGTAMPGETGNVYLFAHSAGDLLEMARMNAVFYLLSKLEKGDKIYMKFGDKKFVYTVYDKKVVEATEIGYINNRNDNGKMMTLQTCTPPGTDWQRLLVFARIQENTN
jgi:LPXTG-site transpeptidase (sortase) family protein